MIAFPAIHQAALERRHSKNWLFQFYYDIDSGTTLNEDLDDSEFQVDVVDGTAFKTLQVVKIDHEKMLIGTILANTLIVTRGYDNTAAVTHSNGATAYINHFTGMAFQDTIVDGEQYSGIITSKPQIRSGLDLVKCKAGSDKVSIRVKNDNIPDALSQTVFGGSRLYLNRNIKIYSQLNGETSLANCGQLYSGRLFDVDHGVDFVTLFCIHRRPWDFLTIPNIRTAAGNYFPAVYGDFTNEESEDGNEQFVESAKCWPAVKDLIIGPNLYCLMPYGSAFGLGEADPTDQRLHYFDPGLDLFIPFDDNNTTTEDYENNGEALTTLATLLRAFKFRKIFISSNSLVPWTDPDDIIAGTPGSTVSHTNVLVTNAKTTMGVDITLPEGMITSLTFTITSYIVVDVALGSGQAALQYSLNSTNGSDGSWTNLQLLDPPSNTPSISTDTIQIDVETTKIWFRAASFASLGVAVVSYRLYDFFLTANIQANTNEPDLERRSKIKQLYSGGDGLPKFWDTDAALVEIQDAHRDVLQRFVGLVDDQIDTASFDALATARAGWDIRWWQITPKDIQKIL